MTQKHEKQNNDYIVCGSCYYICTQICLKMVGSRGSNCSSFASEKPLENGVAT